MGLEQDKEQDQSSNPSRREPKGYQAIRKKQFQLQKTKRLYISTFQKSLSESIKTLYRKHGIQVYFKGGKTIKDLLMTLKDKNSITEKSGVIDRFK